MLKFPFLYVGLKETIRDILKLVEDKNIWSEENPGISNCFTNLHPDCPSETYLGELKN